MASKSVFLEVDTSIRDRNLMFMESKEEDDIFNILKANEQLPPIFVQLKPGFCVKSHQNNGKKVFINFCHTDKIPAPIDLTTEKIMVMMHSDDEINYRVPMTFGEIRIDHDKKGEEASVLDIGINTDLIQKCLNDQVFKEFIIHLGFAGCENKWNIEAVEERIVLKNKKAMGTIAGQYIQQRKTDYDSEQKKTFTKLESIIQPNNQEMVSAKTNKIQVLDEVTQTPNYRLFKKTDDITVLYGEFYLPYVVSSKDISVDIGEDRLILETTSGKYLLDIFHPYKVISEQSICEYNIASKFLTATMPLRMT